MKTKILFSALVASFVLHYSTGVLAATSINSVNRYAYGANIGWMDWRGDTNNGAVINATYCAGSIYSANVGWISLGTGTPTNGVQYQNLSPNDYGVNVDVAGNLRGYAYGANIGWINFEANGAATVDFATGNLNGYAYGANVGWISLSNAFAHVQTMPLAPANDLCAGAIVLTNSVTYAMSTLTATTNGDLAPGCVPTLGKGVWFAYTPFLTGPVTISTCGSSFDTGLGIYTGSCGAMTLVACDDDNGPACNGVAASVTFSGTAGITYYIQAGGWGGASGNLNIMAASPSNDQCAGAVALVDGVPYAMSTTNATSAGDPMPTCLASFGKGVWFTYSAPASGQVLISTCGSDTNFDTAMGLYQGSCDALSQIACDDDYGPSCYGRQASLNFLASGGTTYYILVGGYGNSSGNLNILASIVPTLQVSGSASNLTITWPGNGTLQSATNLDPLINWTDLTNGGGSWTEPMTNPAKFFRLKK